MPAMSSHPWWDQPSPKRARKASVVAFGVALVLVGGVLYGIVRLSGAPPAAPAAEKSAIHNEEATAALNVAAAHLDNALLAAKLPYFVDANVLDDASKSKRIVLLYEFSVASTELYRSGNAVVRAMRLRRID